MTLLYFSFRYSSIKELLSVVISYPLYITHGEDIIYLSLSQTSIFALSIASILKLLSNFFDFKYMFLAINMPIIVNTFVLITVLPLIILSLYF